MIFEKRQLVRELQPGQPVADLFVLAEARQGQARNGPYWSLGLQDASGRIEARIWSPQSQAYEALEGGSLAFVEGQAVSYRDKVQLNVDQIRLLDLEEACAAPEPLDLSKLIPCSPEPPNDMLERIEELCRQHLHYPPWRKLAGQVLADEDVRSRLLKAVGGKAIHHAYVGGLLEHTLGVLRLCITFSDLYPTLDREILVCAAVFHDLGKAWEIGGGLSPDYTDEGRLLGHIQIGLEILNPFLQNSRLDPLLVTHFKHIILSHHGEYHFGSPKRPKTAEAMALHYADNLDAKMNQFREIYADMAGGAGNGEEEGEDAPGWSQFQRSLERFVYRPPHTPGRSSSQRRGDKKENQCLLPLKE